MERDRRLMGYSWGQQDTVRAHPDFALNSAWRVSYVERRGCERELTTGDIAREEVRWSLSEFAGPHMGGTLLEADFCVC